MGKHPDVVIIGGGVIGLATAYYLLGDGASVTVVDQGQFGRESSWAGAGIISPGNPKRARSPMGRLRSLSASLFPELANELREATGIDPGYVKCGGLRVYRNERLWRRIAEKDTTSDAEDGATGHVLDRTELHRRFPALSDQIVGSVWYPEMAQVRNPRYAKALLAACGRRGGILRPGCPAVGFDHAADRVISVRTPTETLSAGRFVIAAGAWSDFIASSLQVRPGIRPVRGQIALLSLPAPLFKPIVEIDSRYLVPRPDGRVLVGSTEENVGFDKRTTAGAIQKLLQLAIDLVPGLAGAAVERTWAGLRPASTDGRPILGPLPGWSNVFLAAGHFRSGLMLSPITGLVMKQLVLGQSTAVDLEPFRLDRPSLQGAENP